MVSADIQAVIVRKACLLGDVNCSVGDEKVTEDQDESCGHYCCDAISVVVCTLRRRLLCSFASLHSVAGGKDIAELHAEDGNCRCVTRFDVGSKIR